MPSPLALINREELFQRCLEDAAFMHQMLSVFRESAPALAQDLHRAVASENWLDARRHAHTLKGSAANLAIETLRGLALRAEQHAADSDRAGMAEVLAQIDVTLQRALVEVETLLREDRV